MKFRKKPVVVEAYLWDGDITNVMNWEASIVNKSPKTYLSFVIGQGLTVKTLEGRMEVPVGNYIICGVHNELYSCEPNIFSQTYENVEE